MMTVVAIGCAFMSVTIFQVARSFISGSKSLKNLIERIDYNIYTTTEMLQRSINDVNLITQRAGGQMERVESIVGDARLIAKDAQISMHVIEETLVPAMTNLHAISAGLRKGVDTWRETGAESPIPPHDTQNQNLIE